jgi:hypothetical protein
VLEKSDIDSVVASIYRRGAGGGAVDKGAA